MRRQPGEQANLIKSPARRAQGGDPLTQWQKAQNGADATLWTLTGSEPRAPRVPDAVGSNSPIRPPPQTSQNGVLAILRVQGRALPLTAEVI